MQLEPKIRVSFGTCQSADTMWCSSKARIFGRKDEKKKKKTGGGSEREKWRVSVRLGHTPRVLSGFPQRRSPAKYNT